MALNQSPTEDNKLSKWDLHSCRKLAARIADLVTAHVTVRFDDIARLKEHLE
jgi:hypothetical protein